MDLRISSSDMPKIYSLSPGLDHHKKNFEPLSQPVACRWKVTDILAVLLYARGASENLNWPDLSEEAVYI